MTHYSSHCHIADSLSLAFTPAAKRPATRSSLSPSLSVLESHDSSGDEQEDRSHLEPQEDIEGSVEDDLEDDLEDEDEEDLEVVEATPALEVRIYLSLSPLDSVLTTSFEL